MPQRRPGRPVVTAAARREHGFGDRRKWQNLAGGSQFHRFARHAVNHARRFILCDGPCAGLAHLEQALGAIVAHAGEQNAHRVGPCGLGHRREEYIDRRALVTHPWPCLDADVIAADAVTQQHMEISGCYQREAGAQRVAIFRLFYIHGAKIVQPFRKGAGELRGDVLRDHNPGAPLRQAREYGWQWPRCRR